MIRFQKTVYNYQMEQDVFNLQIQISSFSSKRQTQNMELIDEQSFPDQNKKDLFQSILLQQNENKSKLFPQFSQKAIYQNSQSNFSQINNLSKSDIIAIKNQESFQSFQNQITFQSSVAQESRAKEQIQSFDLEKSQKNNKPSKRYQLPEKRKKIFKKHNNTLKLVSLKNFLQVFKKPHFDEIEHKFPNLFKKYNSLKDMKEQTHLSRFDYVQLYEIEQLQETWSQFFRQRKHFRALLTSKTSPQNKQNYFPYINRFEQAFKNKSFPSLK